MENIDNLDETIKKGLEKIDELAEKNPMTFAEYCDKKLGINYQGKQLDILFCIEQLEGIFGVATDNMLTALIGYHELLKAKEACDAYTR